MITCDAATAFNRYVEAPMMAGSSLDSLVKYEAEHNIPFSLEEVFWDYRVLNVRHEDQLAEIILFAVKKELVEAKIRTAKRAGLPVDGVQLAPVALLNFLQHEELLRDGTAVIWVDYDRIDIVVRCGERVWFRSLPDGAHRFVENVREELGVKHREAVRILSGAATCSDPDAVAIHRTAEATRLAAEVARVLRYYSGAQDNFQLQNAVVVSGSSMCPPLGTAMKAALETKVFGLKRFRRVAMQGGIETPEITDHPGRYGPAIGCALQLRGMAEFSIELFPKETRRFIAGRRLYHALSLMFIAFFVLANFWRSDQLVSEAEVSAKALGDAIAEATLLQENYDAGSDEQQIRRRLEPFRRASQGRTDVVNVVDRVLASIEGANSQRTSETRLHVVRVGGARGDSTQVIRVQLTLAQELKAQADPTALTGLLRRDVIQVLASQGGTDDLTMPPPFVAGDMVLTKPADEGLQMTRRRFVIWKITF
ncbi:MAG: pilus assembly protein PilM, partial [Pirellulaceae bacterium]|nr:pilus assembly protein PilM [Pirellulaceae bacterium]